MKKKIIIIAVLVLAVLSYFIVNYHSNVNNKYLGRMPSIVKRYEPDLLDAQHLILTSKNFSRKRIGANKLYKRIGDRMIDKFEKYVKKHKFEGRSIPIECRKSRFSHIKLSIYSVDERFANIELLCECVDNYNKHTIYKQYPVEYYFYDDKGKVLFKLESSLFKATGKSKVTDIIKLYTDKLMQLEHLAKVVMKFK